MHIVQVYHSKVPVNHYGGMERVIEALIQGFLEQGHRVTLISFKGDYIIPGCQFIDLDRYSSMEEANQKFVELIPSDTDIVHFHLPYNFQNFPFPYVCTIHGNLSDSDDRNILHQNSIFLCKDHANRHGFDKYVFNGLNPSAIPLGLDSLKKRNYFSFLGRASLKRKGLHLAKKVASHFKTKLIIGGGKGFGWFGKYKFLGNVNNQEKFDLLKNSKALLFPILWEEPFGLVMIEAMFCGTTVFALNHGSVAEVLGAEPNNYFLIGKNLDDLVEKMSHYSFEASPQEIRDYAMRHFSHLKMCDSYMRYYLEARNT